MSRSGNSIASHEATVALVEGNERLRAALGTSITERGYELVNVSNSQQALATVASAQITLVDLLLDDMDGLSLIEEIRARHRNMHIIAVLPDRVARDQLDMEDAAIVQMASQSGANAVFIAPFNLGELLTTIDRFEDAARTINAA